MAIVEIDRTYNHFDRLLGEHRWSEFIKDPNDEERNRVSQVFYCFHNSYREVQKDGKCKIASRSHHGNIDKSVSYRLEENKRRKRVVQGVESLRMVNSNRRHQPICCS